MEPREKPNAVREPLCGHKWYFARAFPSLLKGRWTRQCGQCADRTAMTASSQQPSRTPGTEPSQTPLAAAAVTACRLVTQVQPRPTHRGAAPGLVIGHLDDVRGTGIEEEVARTFSDVQLHLQAGSGWGQGQGCPPWGHPGGHGDERLYLHCRVVVDGHLLRAHPHVLHKDELYGGRHGHKGVLRGRGQGHQGRG